MNWPLKLATKRFESLHRAYLAFDIPMSLFNHVVQIIALPDANRFLIRFVGVRCGQCHGVGATFIESDHFWFAVKANLSKET